MPLRKGKCKRCGKCCTFKHMWKTLSKKEKWLMFLINPFKFFKTLKNKDKIKCPHMRVDKNDLAFCMKYKRRPSFCREYPTDNHLINGCGYYFE